MDAAKIMWVLYEHPEVDFLDMAMRFMDIRKRVYTFPKMGEKAYFIAVPTSAGTGSEVTPFAVITDETTGQKYPLADYELLPKMAIVDADMMMNAPKGLTSASGIDALVHSIEAYVSMMATEFTDGLAIEAIKTIFEYLPRAYEEGANDPIAREKMANAATMAGMAFANAFLGVCHSMAHKLGAYHHLPHGVANALMICHVLRYHPYFAKIREIVDSGELGQIISVNHVAAVGIDRTTHSYVRGPWRREETSNPMLLAKCCHDVDFLLWITRSPCRKLSSFGSLRWFRAANAPQTSAERCIDCPVEHDCPYSAVDLYCTRRDWISNFDVPQGRTLDEVLLEELRHGPYGRCIYRCDNDVVDHQLLTMELADETILSLSMDIFTQDDCRRTHIKMTHGEIFGDERKLSLIHI